MTDTEPGPGVTRTRDSEVQISIQSVRLRVVSGRKREVEGDLRATKGASSSLGATEQGSFMKV